MDRTGIIAVLLCVVAYIALTTIINKEYPPPPPHKAAAVATVPGAAAPSVTSAGANGAPVVTSPTPALSEATPASTTAPEKTNFLENDFLKVTFTTKGASIKQIALKKHKEGDNGVVILNEQAHDNIMSLRGWPGSDTASFSVESTPKTLIYTDAMGNGVTWTRSYTLGVDYTLAVKDTLSNAGVTEAVFPAYSISVGRAEPLLVAGHYQPISNLYVGSGWLTTRKFHLTTIRDFNGRDSFTSTTPEKGIFSAFFTQDINPLRWVAVEDQFFAVLLTPTAPERNIPEATFQCFNQRDADGSIPKDAEPDIEAFANFPEVHIPAEKAFDLNYTLFAGPKEHGRLDDLGQSQGELMNYGMFVILIAPMLTVLHFFSGFFHNYGVAIIFLTLLVKAITWPLQSFANRSGKRMQAVAPKIKELQAKYKEQPEKLNTETFALYRDYGVNPFGGCLPALVQMPVFFSLYFMLQNAVELRGQSFLWVHDLTQPDTIFSCALPFTVPFLNATHFVINPLPLMVTGLTMVMMRMTPQIGDPAQAKVAQFMPLIFLFIFYNFAAGLSLYYVINNCVSIIQIYRNLRKPLPALVKKPKKT